MTAQQRFLLLLILVGGIATILGLVSRRARFVPYPVVLALAGVVVGILPGTPLPLIGAILAPTDPIAVVTLLRRVAAPAGLTAILEGESLLNDGTGVAAFSAVLGTVVSGSLSATDATIRFLELTAGGTIVGLAVGF